MMFLIRSLARVLEVAVAIYANDELQGYRSSNGNPRAPIGGRKLGRYGVVKNNLSGH